MLQENIALSRWFLRFWSKNRVFFENRKKIVFFFLFFFSLFIKNLQCHHLMITRIQIRIDLQIMSSSDDDIVIDRWSCHHLMMTQLQICHHQMMTQLQITTIVILYHHLMMIRYNYFLKCYCHHQMMTRPNQLQTLGVSMYTHWRCLVPMFGFLSEILLVLDPSESGDPEPDLLWQLLREGVVYKKRCFRDGTAHPLWVIIGFRSL